LPELLERVVKVVTHVAALQGIHALKRSKGLFMIFTPASYRRVKWKVESGARVGVSGGC
jgi:hypothetical protein